MAAISFETPDRTWSAGRTRPTIDLFLWEIIRSPKLPRTGMEQRVDVESGARQRRPVTPVVDLHYLVTAWASEPRDEHQLLGALLTCVLAHRRLPDDVLPEALDGMRCRVGLAAPEVRVPNELWMSLEGGARAALQFEVSLPLEVFDWQDTAAAAEEIGVHLDPLPRPAAPVEDSAVPVLSRRRVNGALVMEGRADRREPPEES